MQDCCGVAGVELRGITYLSRDQPRQNFGHKSECDMLCSEDESRKQGCMELQQSTKRKVHIRSEMG